MFFDGYDVGLDVVPPTEDGLISYHPLEANALDDFGSYDGTAYSTTYDGQSALLTGATSSYITLGAGKTAFKVPTYSVSIWIKPTSIPAQAYIVDNNFRTAGSGNTYNSGCAVRIANNKILGTYTMLNNETTTDSNGLVNTAYLCNCSSDADIVSDGWIHTGYVVNGNSAKLFINGILNSTVTSIQSIRYATLDDNYALGILKYDSSVYYPFPGRIAHHRAYDRALTDEEMTNIYNYEKGDFGL